MDSLCLKCGNPHPTELCDIQPKWRRAGETVRLETLTAELNDLISREGEYQKRATEAEATVAVLVEALQNHNLRMGQAGPILDLIADLPAAAVRYQREHEAMREALHDAYDMGTMAMNMRSVFTPKGPMADSFAKLQASFAALDALKETP